MQLNFDYLLNLNQKVKQQQNEIGSTIRSEVEAQARAQRKANQGSAQSSNNQAVQSYNNRISSEGQQRMEYYNNPDNYINRDITNRNSSYINNERHPTSSQTRDLRTEPIHSENLNSKSLQSLREAKVEYLFDENWEFTPYAKAVLFDAPSLEEYNQKENINYFDEFLIERAMERAKTDALKNEVARKNDMVDMTKKGLGIVGGIATKGMMSVGTLVSANLNLYSELVKYWNECSSGTRIAKTSDTFEILGKATLNTAVDFVAPWVGDQVGVAYLGMENAGKPIWDMLTSAQIDYTLQNFAVNDDKREE